MKIVALLLLIFSPFSQAQMYKCEVNGVKSFSNKPCSGKSQRIKERHKGKALSGEERKALRESRAEKVEEWRKDRQIKEKMHELERQKILFEAEREERKRKERVRYRNLAVQGKIAVGMPKDLLLRSWGKPLRINKSTYGSDQWVYPNGSYKRTYVYVENGVINSID